MPRKAKQLTISAGSTVRAALVVLAVLALAHTAWLAANPRPAATSESLSQHDTGGVATQLHAVGPMAISAVDDGSGSGDAGNLSRHINGKPTDDKRFHSAQVRQLVAEISVVCPSAARELQREMLAPSGGAESNVTKPVNAEQVGDAVDLVSHSTIASGSSQTESARAKITSIRVAQRPTRGPRRIALKGDADPKGGGAWLIDPSLWHVAEDAKLTVIQDALPSQTTESAEGLQQDRALPPSGADDQAVTSELQLDAGARDDAPWSTETATPQAPAAAEVNSSDGNQRSEQTIVLPPTAVSDSGELPRATTPAQPSATSEAESPRAIQSPDSTGPSLSPAFVTPEVDRLSIDNVDGSESLEPTVGPQFSVQQPEPLAAAAPQPTTPVPPVLVAPVEVDDRASKPEFQQPTNAQDSTLSDDSEQARKEPASAPMFEAPAAPATVEPAAELPTPGRHAAPIEVERELRAEISPHAQAAGESAAKVESSLKRQGFAPPPIGMPSMHAGSDPHGLDNARRISAELGIKPGEDPHAKFFAELADNCFPSAKACAKCHEKIYHEWSCSSHAYAFVSPMYQKFEQKISEVSMGTVGYFCQRCHSPVATSMGIARNVPLWQQPEVAREGVTCVACHRVNERYGRVNGERRVVPGDIYAPVYGGIGGDGVVEVVSQKNKYKVKTSPSEKGPGQPIHTEGRYFDQLSASEYCASCHQVAVHPGIKLEVVWEQYRASPAHQQGITCQACHMGTVPGVPSRYEQCAIAEVAGQKVNENRKHANHVFYGPGYSIAHPGVFPFHLKADRWNVDEWLLFDWRAGWGTDEFEDKVDAGELHVAFPEVWTEADDRYDAREIIEDNQEKLALKTRLRTQVMENGSHVDGPFFATQPRVGCDIDLHYIVANTNSGHNLPTASLGAQPQLWANVVLIGPRGQRLWETGYTDKYGDVCDIHSREVRAGRVPFDSQLFNLQTMFLITGAVGTDREFFLPVNVDFDQLPFLRPGAIPITVTNHPPFIRMESRSIGPLGKKKVKYSIPGRLLREPGRYRLSFRMRSRTEPIYFMEFCDATTEMQRAMNEGMIDVHPYSVEFDVH